jgi:hypothetical protein
MKCFFLNKQQRWWAMSTITVELMAFDFCKQFQQCSKWLGSKPLHCVECLADWWHKHEGLFNVVMLADCLVPASLRIPHCGFKATFMHANPYRCHIKYSLLSCDFNQNWLHWQILVKLPYNKFHTHPKSGSQVVTKREMDRQDTDNKHIFYNYALWTCLKVGEK